jgi:hypothetical protein
VPPVKPNKVFGTAPIANGLYMHNRGINFRLMPLPEGMRSQMRWRVRATRRILSREPNT